MRKNISKIFFCGVVFAIFFGVSTFSSFSVDAESYTSDSYYSEYDYEISYDDYDCSNYYNYDYGYYAYHYYYYVYTLLIERFPFLNTFFSNFF